MDMSFPDPMTQVVVQCHAVGGVNVLTYTSPGTMERVHTANSWKVKKKGTLLVFDNGREVARYGPKSWINVWIRDQADA